MKKRIALAAPFVVTVSAGCGKDPAPPQMTHNPPAIDTAPPDPHPKLADYPQLVNPKDADGRAIFFAGGAKCYVEMPFPPLREGEQRYPGTAPPQKDVTCPKDMSKHAWDLCIGGTIHKKEAGNECVCFRMGNPPYPPSRTDCP